MTANQIRTTTRPRRGLLHGQRGSIRDSLASVIVLAVIATAVATSTPSAAAVVTTTGSISERLSTISALVDDKRATVTWGTPDDPAIRTLTLPSGTIAKVAAWTTAGDGGSTYEALIPRDRADSTSTCLTPANAADRRCLHAELFRANDITTLVPNPIVRMDPSLNAPVGTVNPAVKGSPDATPAGTALAQATPTSSRTWRYLIHAKSLTTSATLRFQQNGSTLATMPILPAPSNYIGTIAVAASGPVTLTVVDGSAATDTILIYDAGAAS
ncbi:hypothetical protein [Leifsonia shinshuensis]|uniref:Uncharacterized protein n=1 Tax=Leifsonia shinshuensis TaxID=150026 RepID=A0A7G6YHE7_9MICO|nr:hypothetical protein [Leifsonia shinshuensis]QNE37912.1 hypothetical protein F1C12_21760 [Leifsonia shinshuensis]